MYENRPCNSRVTCYSQEWCTNCRFVDACSPFWGKCWRRLPGRRAFWTFVSNNSWWKLTRCDMESRKSRKELQWCISWFVVYIGVWLDVWNQHLFLVFFVSFNCFQFNGKWWSKKYRLGIHDKTVSEAQGCGCTSEVFAESKFKLHKMRPRYISSLTFGEPVLNVKPSGFIQTESLHELVRNSGF